MLHGCQRPPREGALARQARGELPRSGWGARSQCPGFVDLGRNGRKTRFALDGFPTNWFAFWVSRGDLVDLACLLWRRVLLFRRELSWGRKGMFLPELFLGIWVAVRLLKADESKFAVFGWIACCLPIQSADRLLTGCGPVPLQGAAAFILVPIINSFISCSCCRLC